MYVLDLMDVDCGGTLVEHRIGSRESFRDECETRGIGLVDAETDTAPDGAAHLFVISSTTLWREVADAVQSLRCVRPDADAYAVCEVGRGLPAKLKAAFRVAQLPFRRGVQSPLLFSAVRGEVYGDGLVSNWPDEARKLSLPRRLKALVRRACFDAERVAKLDYILFRL